MHPVQRVVESLYAAGRCPRLHVNAKSDGVVVPDDVRERWGERLILDLDQTYPLALSYDDDGLSADLSFGGVVSRCVFPFAAVYVVADRATGRGIVLDKQMPESVKRARSTPTTAPLPETDLRAVFGEAGGAGDEGDADPEQPEPGDEAPLPGPAVARALGAVGPSELEDELEDDDETEFDEHDPEPAPAEERAQARRAAFKVIDGGG